MALEILALRLARDLGLYAAALRLRGKETGGAEVDVIADGVHLHYSRWLLQCKNVNRVSVSSIAKEVGMAVVLKAHVIAMVTTGGFSRDVESFADSVSESSPLQVVLIPGPLLELYRQHGVGHVINSLKEQSRRILDLKRGQIARSANSG